MSAEDKIKELEAKLAATLQALSEALEKNDLLIKQLELNKENGTQQKQVIKKLADGKNYLIDAIAYDKGFRIDMSRAETDKEFLEGILKKDFGFIKEFVEE